MNKMSAVSFQPVNSLDDDLFSRFGSIEYVLKTIGNENARSLMLLNGREGKGLTSQLNMIKNLFVDRNQGNYRTLNLKRIGKRLNGLERAHFKRLSNRKINLVEIDCNRLKPDEQFLPQLLDHLFFKKDLKTGILNNAHELGDFDHFGPLDAFKLKYLFPDMPGKIKGELVRNLRQGQVNRSGMFRFVDGMSESVSYTHLTLPTKA